MAKQEIRDLTIVITGPSTGIGRATALELAREGANLVFGARSEELLEELVQECEALGGRATYLQTDVTDPDAMKNLAQKACDHFDGKIDVWINNAGVGSIGSFVETPIEVHDQIIRTNLMGYMHGAHAALPVFLKQGKGQLINLASMGSWVPQAYAVAYSASKFGLRGFSEALRGELTHWPEIHISDVFPAIIDTPAFQHSGNYAGRELKLPPPVFDPSKVARAIKDLIISPKSKVMVGWTAGLGRLSYFLAPNLMRWSMARGLENSFKTAKPVAITSGNLFQHSPKGTGIRGEAGANGRNLARGKAIIGVSALLAGLAGGIYLMNKKRHTSLATS